MILWEDCIWIKEFLKQVLVEKVTEKKCLISLEQETKKNKNKLQNKKVEALGWILELKGTKNLSNLKVII